MFENSSSTRLLQLSPFRKDWLQNKAFIKTAIYFSLSCYRWQSLVFKGAAPAAAPAAVESPRIVRVADASPESVVLAVSTAVKDRLGRVAFLKCTFLVLHVIFALCAAESLNSRLGWVESIVYASCRTP